MAQLADLPASKVSTAAGFPGDTARWQLADKLQHLRSPQPFAQNSLPFAVSPMDLKCTLPHIEADRDHLRHDRSPLWIHAGRPWHADAAGGRLHHQRLPQDTSGAMNVMGLRQPNLKPDRRPQRLTSAQAARVR